MDIISADKIRETKAFKKLSISLQNIMVKRANRSIIDNAFIIYKNTGQITNTLGPKQIEILNELIENYEKAKNTTI